MQYVDNDVTPIDRYINGYVATRDKANTAQGGVTKDVAFNRHSMNDGHHVSPFDGGGLKVGADDIRVKLVQGINEDSFKDVLSRAQRATIGVEPGALDGVETDWEEMLKGGLQTALETQTLVFEVAGVSRACTHQLVRTRKAAYHQQSMRASFYGNRPETRIPESVWANPTARRHFVTALELCHEAYRIACEEDISYQDARYILPEGTDNYIMLEYPVREFLNVYAYRACSMFQWEIVSVMRQCREVLIEAHPWLEPYVKISCEKTKGSLDYGDRPPAVTDEQDTAENLHHCTFQGWEEVEGQCDFPWARESNRSYQPQAHKISRK